MCDNPRTSPSDLVHNLFITDVEYDADEATCGRVMTGTRLESVASSTIDMWDNEGVYAGEDLLFSQVKVDSVVRFVSDVSNTVTDYMFVRELIVNSGGAFSVRIDAPLILDHADQFRMQLVREWIPRPLKLLGRFKMITACEVRAYAFCGLSSGNLYEGVTGEPQQDYIGLEINEIPGNIQSSNRNMERMLAVLPTHMPAYHPSSWNDSRDAMVWLPEGFAKTTFSSPLPAISTITPRLVDRKGATIKAARFHMWIRLHAVRF
jgi:hypothetical protein